ncbi:MAG: DUF2635 domain-containing protein [Deltaproteobacteria bacterium]|nr:DUF2635 domain-containing protein [Deltaproteobacteria bacterium]
MAKIFIKPGPGLRVLDPATGNPLPPEGLLVEDGTHWRRRLNDGDVEAVESPKSAIATPESAQKGGRK